MQTPFREGSGRARLQVDLVALPASDTDTHDLFTRKGDSAHEGEVRHRTSHDGIMPGRVRFCQKGYMSGFRAAGTTSRAA